jgi:hypothetical protein
MYRCFISYSSHELTNKFVSKIKRCLQQDDEINKYLDVWNFQEQSLQPDPEIWKQAVREALFHVIVADPNYLLSPFCKEELATARKLEKERQKQYNNKDLKTVFGISPDPGKVPDQLKNVFNWMVYEAELCKAIRDQLYLIAPQLTDMQKFSFKEWPDKLLNENGEADVAIIVGSTGKETPVGNNQQEKKRILRIFNPYLTIDDEMEIQSERPAEYLPFLTSSLERLSRRKKIELKLPDPDLLASVPEVYCDRTAITYYPKVLKNRNIITIGGGDTNMYSRFVHRYYRGLLPVHFTSPEDSKELCYTVDVGNKGPKIKILSTYENKSIFHGLLLIFPNPLNKEKFVIWLAGLTALGTQAGIKILADNPKELSEGIHHNARVFKSDDDGRWRAEGYQFL